MEAPSIQITPDNFQAEVIEASNQVPVAVLFWADQVPESLQTRQQLETLASQYGGKLKVCVYDKP